MNRHFAWGQCEDEPTVASVYRGETEDVSEESAVSRRVFAVKD
jgi:hypothetical protein